MVGLIDYDFGGLILLVSSLFTLYLDLNHVWHLCLSLGRGQTSVKPTGHARFFVENCQTYFEILSYFLKKSIGQKGGLFYLFIFLL